MPIDEKEELDIEELYFDDDPSAIQVNNGDNKANDLNKKTKRTIKDILKIVISNLCVILSGVLTSFVLPKMIGVEDYGNYKIFSLYCTYVDLLQLGIMDGIYLYYGGKDYDELDKSRFRFYTKFFLVFQATVTAIMALICACFLKSDYRFIPKVYQNMMTRLPAGEYIISNPALRSLINIKFPYNTYKQFPNG